MPDSIHRPAAPPPRSILLIKPGSMGDVIHALPVASAIHAAWPTSRLIWVVDPRWMPLLDHNPAIDSTLPFPRQNFRGLFGKLQAVRWYCELSKLQPDLAIDLQGLFRSGLMASASRALKTVGLRDAREFSSLFYSSSVEVGQNEHAVRRYLRCLPAIGIEIPTRLEFTFPTLKQHLKYSLKANYIVIHPFARGAGKSLAPDAIAAFSAEFASLTDTQIVLVGVGKAPTGLSSNVLNLADQTSLLELISILREARFTVSVDSGPMHLAAGLGVPLLGIHTWSDPRLVGPYQENAWIWQGGEICRQDFGRAPLPERPFTAAHAREVARFVAGRIRSP